MRKVLTFALILSLAISCARESGTVSSEVNVPNTPVLALKDMNNVASVRLNSPEGTAYSLKTVSVRFSAAAGLGDIRKVALIKGGETVAETDVKTASREKTVVIKCDIPVEGPVAEFAIGLKTGDVVDLDNKITVKDISFKTTEGRVKADCTGAPVLRTAIALRQNDQDGVDNCRIPGLAITPKGTIIAIYDARRDRDRDLQGDIDICYNRSTDGGRTWSPMMVAMDMGEWGGLPQKFNGVSDPCILVDDNTGDIYISACWMHGVIDKETGKWVEGLTEQSTDWNHQWAKNGTQPGYDVKQSSQWMVVKSTDDGLTWSEPMNYTREVKPESYCLTINGPGAGITLEDGTLVFPAQGRREDASAFSTLITSRDGGKTWKSGKPAFADPAVHSNESMCVQLADGSIMLNMRSSKNRGNHTENGRLVAITKDLGETWEVHPTSGHVLTEPTCQGSILKHMYKKVDGSEKELLFFFNPNDPDKRVHHSIRCSLDEGMTWPSVLEVDEGLGAGYSCMISVDNETIGVIYEGSGACLVYQQIKIGDVIDLKTL
ncbi:MAG: exo-alpha-sialidase [Bacteroidales bacterium]|nr:exo-alpha-sialidase [Bacteroidales bacterium]